MTENHLYPHPHTVDQSMHSKLNGHLPLVIWLTGLSGSGKSTIANRLEYRLVEEFHAHTYLLDGDNIRGGLNAGLGFSDADRKENIRRIGEVAKLMYDAGLIVITAFISPFHADRDTVRKLLPAGGFWEVYVNCPVEICAQRDPKGLYQKAMKGEIRDFTGISSGYEVPLSPELVLDTQALSVEDSVDRIINALIEKAVISGPEKRE